MNAQEDVSASSSVFASYDLWSTVEEKPLTCAVSQTVSPKGLDLADEDEKKVILSVIVFNSN